MDNNDIRENLCEMYGDDDLLFMDGFDDCIIGVMERYGMEPIVIYDKGKVIAKHIFCINTIIATLFHTILIVLFIN